VLVSGDNAHGHLHLADTLVEADTDAMTAPTTRDDMCFWLYTSGSTGKPKGAVHTHADLKLTDDLYAGPILGITENDVCYSVAKLFFAYGLGNALTFPMSAGATTVLLPARPTPDLVADLLKKHGVTIFYAVPTFYAAFLASSAAPARRRETAALRVRRRGIAPGRRPPLERTLRRGHSRRHRLHRNVAHLSHQSTRRREIRHQRQADRRLRSSSRRR
jgi:acyl-coenzyme A synthetase/AMP-(fatty) acid ligase